jgi:hypothetical protein
MIIYALYALTILICSCLLCTVSGQGTGGGSGTSRGEEPQRVSLDCLLQVHDFLGWDVTGSGLRNGDLEGR